MLFGHGAGNLGNHQIIRKPRHEPADEGSMIAGALRSQICVNESRRGFVHRLQQCVKRLKGKSKAPITRSLERYRFLMTAPAIVTKTSGKKN